MKTEEKDKQKRKRKIWLFVLLTAVVALFILLGSFISTIEPPTGNTVIDQSSQNNPGKPASQVQGNTPAPKEEIYTFLVAGTDKASNNTDTIMMVNFNVTDKTIRILNIPRDTMVNVDRKIKKINAAYELGGIKQFEEETASLLGFYVNRYVIFRLEGVEKLIDAIGGIDFDVPKNMNYDDPTQDLSIHLKKGYQHLNGEQALGLARFRHTYENGDIDRIGVQQELIKVLAKQALKPENIIKLPTIVSLLMENVETDITAGEMLWLANAAKEVPMSSITTDILPGMAKTISGLSYWVPSKDELLSLINKHLNPTGSPILDIDVVDLQSRN